MLDSSILSDIRNRIPIVAFIGERVPLKKAGRNYKGVCPFHQEKTPSFMVSDEKQIFHCFGCGEGGDVFKFLMKYDNLSFYEAVEILAEKTGVKLPKNRFSKDEDAKIALKKRECLELTNLAKEYFYGLLRSQKGEVARNYLKSRGIKEATVKQLFLGYAENAPDSFARHVGEKNLGLSLELGLIKQRSAPASGYYDFFRGRLMFPILSQKGDVIGFSGRIIDDADKDAAKYLNSPDSLIYHKSASVFGLHHALDAIRRQDQIILVEGNMDMVSLYQAGIQNVVAPLGTALTSAQIRLMARFSKNMVIIFDADEAGFKAAQRALPLFFQMDLAPRAVSLPQGEDPDSFVKKEGPERLTDMAANAQTLFEFYVDRVVSQVPSDTAGRLEALKEIIPIIKESSDTTAQKLYCGYTASKLRIKEEIVMEALTSGKGRQDFSKYAGTDKKAASQSSRDKRMSNIESAEKLLIELMISRPNLTPRIADQISADDFSHPSYKAVAEIFYKEGSPTQGSPTQGSPTQGKNEVSLNELLENLDSDLAGEIRKIAISDEALSDTEAEEMIKDCVGVIKGRHVADEIEKINDEIRQAEVRGDETLVLELLMRKRDISAAQMK